MNMSDLRKPYASTGLAGMKSNPDRESAIDLVGAAGRAKGAGVDLWKACYGLEKTAYYRLRNDTLKKFRNRYPTESEAERIVEQAIHEFFGPSCRECEGTGKVGALDLGKVRATCPTCNGSKVRHYTDTTRAAMMSLSYGKTKHLKFKISWVLKVLSNHDTDTNRVMNNELERE